MSAQQARLSDVARFVNGAAFGPDDWSDIGRPIIRIQNLTGSSKVYNRTTRAVNPLLYADPGDLLVSWSATLGVFEWASEEIGLVNQHIFRVIPYGNAVDKRYLFHLLGNALREMATHLHGATMQHVNRAEFLGLNVYLPLIEEQRRIADILDRADALRAKRREALAHLDGLTQSIFRDMFGDPAEPIGEQKALGDVSEVQIGPFGSLLHVEDYISGGVSLINPMHIQHGNIVPDPAYSVSREKAAGLELYRMRVGDVIMGRRGEMGRCAIVGPEHTGLICGTGSLLLRLASDNLTSVYVTHLLGNPSMKRRLESLSRGSTLPNLNRSIVSRLQILCPPIGQQRVFAHKVTTVLGIRASSQSQLVKLDLVFDALQKRAFAGQL